MVQYSNIRIGPVVKKDVMKASTMLEHESQYATILAFDVKVERDAQEMADTLGVKIFQADIIYHLFDKFMAYREELKQRKREEFKHVAVFPCKMRIMPQFVFNSRDPIVVGVMIEGGIVREGTPICVPSKEFLVRERPLAQTGVGWQQECLQFYCLLNIDQVGTNLGMVIHLNCGLAMIHYRFHKRNGKYSRGPPCGMQGVGACTNQQARQLLVETGVSFIA
uniref:Translation initiation factor IF- 2 domain-containing protein n=1 Tax=Timema genevievae TaxID=629358 RepID=A0A7R9K1C4_TIMGE|nr:unnamed protein product [Timema genevievae]